MEHHFNIHIAELLGIEEAIIIHNIHFWVLKNATNGRHFYDGRYWTYNSCKSFRELFPYMSDKKIYRTLKKLVQQDILIKSAYNELKMDRTAWYSFTYSGILLLKSVGYDVNEFSNCNNEKGQNEKMERTKRENASGQNDTMHFSKMENAFLKNDQAIPYNKPYNKQDSNIHTQFNFLQSLIDAGVDRQIAEEYMQVRKVKRATNTLTAYRGLEREAKKAGICLNDAIRICVERSWQGFKAEWYKKDYGVKDWDVDISTSYSDWDDVLKRQNQ